MRRTDADRERSHQRGSGVRVRRKGCQPGGETQRLQCEYNALLFLLYNAILILICCLCPYYTFIYCENETDETCNVCGVSINQRLRLHKSQAEISEVEIFIVFHCK